MGGMSTTVMKEGLFRGMECVKVIKMTEIAMPCPWHTMLFLFISKTFLMTVIRKKNTFHDSLLISEH